MRCDSADAFHCGGRLRVCHGVPRIQDLQEAEIAPKTMWVALWRRGWDSNPRGPKGHRLFGV